MAEAGSPLDFSVKQYSGLPVPSSDLAYGKGNYGASGAALPSG